MRDRLQELVSTPPELRRPGTNPNQITGSWGPGDTLVVESAPQRADYDLGLSGLGSSGSALSSKTGGHLIFLWSK
jgi:hypothetical protein